MTVWIKQHEGFEPRENDRPDLRALLNHNYDMTGPQLAEEILSTVLDCKRVHVEQLAGVGTYAERE
ncbi:MAG: hypothetical protein ACRC9R_08465 [Enterovibrio sp.]